MTAKAISAFGRDCDSEGRERLYVTDYVYLPDPSKHKIGDVISSTFRRCGYTHSSHHDGARHTRRFKLTKKGWVGL